MGSSFGVQYSTLFFNSRCNYSSMAGKTDAIYSVSYVSEIFKGPEKLIQWVKVAHTFSQCVSNLFHFIVSTKMADVMHEADHAYSIRNTW